MKSRRLIPAILITFIFIFGYEWVLHGILLKDLYETTHQLWRPQSVMPQYLPFLFGGQFLFAVFLGLLFSKGYENRGIGEGARFGLWVGLLLSAGHLMWYAVQPVNVLLAVFWVLGSLVEMLAAGILLAGFSRPRQGLALKPPGV